MIALWKKAAYLTVAAVMAGQLFAVSEAEAQSKVGVSAAVRGQVFVRSGGDQERARVAQNILLQDQVLTKQQSALQILLLDESTFTVGENCEMIIDRFVYDPDQNAGEMSGQVLKGAFRFVSGRIGKANPTKANITTRAATIGIRGTSVEGAVGPDAIRLAELLGIDTSGASQEDAVLIALTGPSRDNTANATPGIIRVGNGNGSKTVSQPYFVVFVGGPRQAPKGPFKMTAEVLEYFDFWLRTVPFGDSFGDQERTGGDLSGQDSFNLPGDNFPLNELFQDELFDSQLEEIFDENDGGENDGCGEFCNDGDIIINDGGDIILLEAG